MPMSFPGDSTMGRTPTAESPVLVPPLIRLRIFLDDFSSASCRPNFVLSHD